MNKPEGPVRVFREFLKKDRYMDRRLNNIETQEPFFRLRHKNIDNTDSPYTAGHEDVIFADDASGAITINLPAAADNVGKTYTIKKMSAVATGVTADANGAELIDGSLTYGLTSQYETVGILCDGGNWWVLWRRT